MIITSKVVLLNRLDVFFVLVIAVAYYLYLFVKSSKLVWLVCFFNLYPVIELKLVTSGWVSKTAPDPGIYSAVEFWPLDNFLFSRLVAFLILTIDNFGQHLRLLVYQ